MDGPSHLPPVYVGYCVWVRRATAGWAPAGEQLSIRESLEAPANAMGRPLLWALLLGALLFVADATWLVATRPEERLTGAFGILFFGACSVVFARMIALKRDE